MEKESPEVRDTLDDVLVAVPSLDEAEEGGRCFAG